MGVRSIRISIGLSVLLFAASACHIPGNSPPATPQPLNQLTLISLVETLTAQVNPVSTTTPPNVNVAVTEAIPTPIALPQPTSEATATPIILPTDTSIPSPVIPMVSVSAGADCRTGPSMYYKLVWIADVAAKFVLVGKNTQTHYWIIRLADGRACWLWGQNATVDGDVNSLPEYSPPPFGRIEGEVRKSAALNAAKLSQAFVDIGLGFPVYQTGNEGTFVFEDVPVGEVKISVTYSGLYFPKKSVSVSAGQLYTVIVVPAPPIIIISPTPRPRPTRIIPCTILQPNCFSFPTQGPALP